MHKVVWNHFTYQWWEPGRASASGGHWLWGGSQVWSSEGTKTSARSSVPVTSEAHDGHTSLSALLALGSFLRAQTSGHAMREQGTKLRDSVSFSERILVNNVQIASRFRIPSCFGIDNMVAPSLACESCYPNPRRGHLPCIIVCALSFPPSTPFPLSFVHSFPYSLFTQQILWVF